MQQQERPFDLLNRVIGQQVLVRLKNNVGIRGKKYPSTLI